MRVGKRAHCRSLGNCRAHVIDALASTVIAQDRAQTGASFGPMLLRGGVGSHSEHGVMAPPCDKRFERLCESWPQALMADAMEGFVRYTIRRPPLRPCDE